MILYLHGFRSSPESSKAQAAMAYMHSPGMPGHFFCPQLPESPEASIALAQGIMAGYPADAITLIGSSMGGFYATWLAEKTGCRAVLLNPVTNPWNIKIMENPPEDLRVEEWEADLETYGAELMKLLVPRITRPERYFLIAATGDELLDYRQMSAHYEGARQIIIEGSDHSLSEFPLYLDEIAAFAGIKKAA